MHKLLERQLRRHKLSDEWTKVGRASLQDISDAYNDFDKERVIIERSLELVSEELNDRNQVLKSKLIQLEDTHEKLQDSLAILNSIFDSTGEAIIGFDRNGQLLRCNGVAKKILKINVEPTDVCLSKTLLKIARHVEKESNFSQHLRKIKRRPLSDTSGIVKLKNQQVFEFHSSAQVIDETLHGRVWCFRNVTQVKENELLVQHQAFHDALTDLPNRLLLKDRLEQAISLAHRTELLVAVLFIDLDYFKKINDTLGHQQGDEMLVVVSKRIKQCLREADTLARFGGDEFVVVLGNIGSHKAAAQTSARIIESLQKTFRIEGKKYHISCSVGVALYPRDDIAGEELIRKADLAMYHAKEQGRGCFQFFDEALERLAHYNFDLENKLRDALKKEEFELYYQPKIRVEDKSKKKVEALMRWSIDGKERVSPSEFIPLAEQMGIIVPLGYWVINSVCQQISLWQSQGISDVVVAINLSAQQFAEQDFVGRIKQYLERYKISGKCLDWEITESILLEDLNQVKGILMELKALGSSISIDDFGTGYSSLQYLQKLPVDTLKIDRSFIVELAENPTEESLVNGIISLAHNLKLSVVAEGVEDSDMVEYLTRQHCDFIQGFYFHKPMNVEEITNIFLSKS
jgi:diguanylate cyclase (GGDEF)-like protein